MVNLKEKPFYLSDEQIMWVEKIIQGMSLDEKINQMFVDMVYQFDPEKPEELTDIIKKYPVGGFRYMNLEPKALWEQNKAIQETETIPALIAANVEEGGNGAVSGGTEIGKPVAIGATRNPENAYLMGLYGGIEAAAVGCNWTFAPIVDILYNWRNCVVSNRAFSSNADEVLANGLAYLKGANEAGIACCMKHFPGDGLDERDQHIVTTYNSLSIEEWDESFGKVYKGMIDAGVESVMIGHIQMPAYSRKLRPGIKDEEIMPATLAPELLQDLLRDKLGFNGLVITDASHMVGMTSKLPRRLMVPTAIASGCDMFLYFRDRDEDIANVKIAIDDGLLSMGRIDEALTRILGMKAMLNLPEKQKAGNLVPKEEDLVIIGCEEHKAAQRKVADEAITLVKNTKNQLPLTPDKYKRIMLYPLGFNQTAVPGQEVKEGPLEVFVQTLEKAGFDVDVWNPSASGLSGKRLLASTPVKDFTDKYDAVILVADIEGFSQTNERRLHWSMPMGPDIPWYVTEMPTIFVSLYNPFHLIDVPMVPTFINAYSPTKETIEAVVDKITGKSEFKGVSPVDAFCDAWDTRI
ncbi:MAG: glycoside hydrolase family 3 protein [Eubacteriaceae bacterium]|jgi:beta-N-acetylhexosaminidase